MVQDRPAKRNRLIRIEKPAETTTDGKTTTTWTLFGRAWVTVEPLTGREYWEAQQQASSITHRIRGTWGDFENVTADFRIALGGRTFHLLEPPLNIEEANVLAELLVEEKKR